MCRNYTELNSSAKPLWLLQKNDICKHFCHLFNMISFKSVVLQCVSFFCVKSSNNSKKFTFWDSFWQSFCDVAHTARKADSKV